MSDSESTTVPAAPESDLPPDAAAPESAEASEAAADEKVRLQLDTKIQKKGACERHVAVTIPREDIDRYFADAMGELMPKAEVPGFRPGRAPRKLVEGRFRDKLKDQVKGALVMDSLTQLTEDKVFAAISEPKFAYEAVELPDEGPLTFEFDIEVRPEFDLPQWKGLQLKRPVRDLTDEQVAKQTRTILLRYGSLTPHDGPAEAEDSLVVNARIRHGEQTLLTLEEATLKVRPELSFPDGVLEGFDALMIGAKAGDRRTGKIQLGDDAAREELRGQEVEAEFEVLDVKRTQLPELTKDLLMGIGHVETEPELQGVVRAEMQRQLVYYQDRSLRQQITSLLLADAQWDLPPDLLRRQARRELERAIMELQSAGFSEEEIRASEHELRRNSLTTTRSALMEHFILERIAEEEKLEVEPEDFEREIERIADQQNESPRRVRARLEKQQLMDTLRNQVIERKTLALILGHAQYTEVALDARRPEPETWREPICGAAEEQPEVSPLDQAQAASTAATGEGDRRDRAALPPG